MNSEKNQTNRMRGKDDANNFLAFYQEINH